MREMLTVLFITITSLMSTGCKTPTMNAHWAASPIQIDGRMDDWADIPVIYNSEESYTIGLANDEERLYLLLRFRDPQRAMSIRTSGLSLWLNGNGNKNKDIKINYRGGPSMEGLKALRLRSKGLVGVGRNNSEQTRTFAHQSDSLVESFTCAIRGVIIEKSIAVDGSEGPSVAFALDQGFFNYEFSIPLTESMVRYYGLGVLPGEEVGIGLKWGGSDRERPDGSNKFGGGRDGFGMPGPAGMGGRKQGRGNRGGQRAGMKSKSEAVETWVRTTLAEPPSE